MIALSLSLQSMDGPMVNSQKVLKRTTEDRVFGYLVELHIRVQPDTGFGGIKSSETKGSGLKIS